MGRTEGVFHGTAMLSTGLAGRGCWRFLAKSCSVGRGTKQRDSTFDEQRMKNLKHFLIWYAQSDEVVKGGGKTVTNEQPQKVIVMPTKSVGVSIILTVLLGPLGMLYSTIWGGLIMFVVSALVGLLTFGLGLVVTWPICVIWAALAASSYNKRLLSGQRQF